MSNTKKRRPKKPSESVNERIRRLEARILTLERIVADKANDSVWPMP
jgi:hypothetical protein